VLGFLNEYIGTLVITLTGLTFVKFILNKQVSTNRLLSIILIIVIPVLINISGEMFNSLFFRTLVSCFLFMILFKVAFKTSYYMSLLSSIIHMISLTLSEILVFLILNSVIKVDADFLYNVFAGSIISNVLICLISYLIDFFFRKPIKKLVDFKIKNYLIFYIVLLFICIIFFFYITFSNIGNGINVFSGLTVIAILLVVIISLIVQVYRNNELVIKYDKLLDFIKKYEVEIDNQRTMRHEIKNQLLTIKSKLIDKDKNKNIISYIDEIISDNNKEINHVIYAKLNKLPPNGIKGLFYFKVSEAHDKDINVSINISNDIENSILSSLNSLMFNQVGKLFGILLDNAIESAMEANKKEIGIEIYTNNNLVKVIISNTYVQKIAGSNFVFSRSSKGDKRGHGLLLARAIINSSNSFSLDTIVTDELYIQELTIK